MRNTVLLQSAEAARTVRQVGRGAVQLRRPRLGNSRLQNVVVSWLRVTMPSRRLTRRQGKGTPLCPSFQFDVGLMRQLVTELMKFRTKTRTNGHAPIDQFHYCCVPKTPPSFSLLFVDSFIHDYAATGMHAIMAFVCHCLPCPCRFVCRRSLSPLDSLTDQFADFHSKCNENWDQVISVNVNVLFKTLQQCASWPVRELTDRK